MVLCFCLLCLVCCCVSKEEARCVEVVCVSCGWFKHIEPHRTYTMLLYAGDPRSLLQQLMAAKTGSRTAVTSYSPSVTSTSCPVTGYTAAVTGYRAAVPGYRPSVTS